MDGYEDASKGTHSEPAKDKISCHARCPSLNHQAPASITNQSPVAALSQLSTGAGEAGSQCQVSVSPGQILYLQTGTNHQPETPGLLEKGGLHSDGS